MDVRTAVEAAVDELEAALTHLQDAALDSCPDQVVESVARRLEVVRRRLDSVDVAVVGAVEQRGIPFAHGCKTTATWLRYGLHVDPTEATRRVKAFERLGTRVCGSVVAGPVFPAAASALAEGAISAAHVRVIAEAVEKLPDEIAALHDRELETQLVAHARTMDPRDLGTAADRACYLLDQDGKLEEAKTKERRRTLDLHRPRRGSAILTGELTDEAAEYLETVFDALAKPRPSEDGTPDERTGGQRRHDALLELCKKAMRHGDLPVDCRGHDHGDPAHGRRHLHHRRQCGGTGTATTGHGYRIPAEVAKSWYDHDGAAEAEIIAVLLAKTRRVEAYSSVQRLFTKPQRLAMMARDFGCSFPRCDSTGLHTEAHHIQEFQDGGETSVSNGTLLCGRNHATFEAMGWQCITLDDVPYWKPPPWIDPDQTPIRKTDFDDP